MGLFKRKKKFTNHIEVQKNGFVFFMCPCSITKDGTYENCCDKVTVGIPCDNCSIVSLFYIAIGIKKEMDSNKLLSSNMREYAIELFIGDI